MVFAAAEFTLLMLGQSRLIKLIKSADYWPE